MYEYTREMLDQAFAELEQARAEEATAQARLAVADQAYSEAIMSRSTPEMHRTMRTWRAESDNYRDALAKHAAASTRHHVLVAAYCSERGWRS